ncbi:2-aminoadipate transaminase [Halanaerobium saccharolyticum]|uniref:2-aminoadipate transaminase n=1 Tax=Halanaerobium saccharolyticum TaxID=43595 RepID=A0A4R7YTL4_9FIRM|nr:PLP-dependent aminotransferase family protein [Halanaerobium saccharolyticum]RAK10247.1 2-aminoadipate transaminase [Halanaerobium saccharolyticum]TDW00459.1 2-aminoadipate transaminase [Halanaerobium saccharolyticum]TDX52044.1 2-aminoadipate transaminase [Halanaerobium saccharolyticum]
MNNIFSDRISDVPKSFIREILKIAVNPDIISFAGGLPNKKLFPVSELQEVTNYVFESSGQEALQYSNTEGFLPLRKIIAERYKEKKGIKILPKNILITNGSQQGLDLLGKIFLNKGDEVILEEPGYLGAIQAFSVYRPFFKTVKLLDSGLNISEFSKVLSSSRPKFIYTVPNFQNPSGISYSDSNRKKISNLIRERELFLIEDDPYGDLRYTGQDKVSFKKLIPEQTILLGSFSKIVAPSFRIGWVVASDQIMDKLIIAKQASDLHTNYISQRILYQYLIDKDIEQHIKKIKDKYNSQRKVMLNSIEKYFPAEVTTTTPEGGMFLWVTLPEEISAMDLFNIAIEKKVAFVPGGPFYINKDDINTLRLNFSCVDEENIEIGIKRLSSAIKMAMN